jgi:organic hydroperoxide reductase OsmC/OhrA
MGMSCRASMSLELTRSSRMLSSSAAMQDTDAGHQHRLDAPTVRQQGQHPERLLSAAVACRKQVILAVLRAVHHDE